MIAIDLKSREDLLYTIEDLFKREYLKTKKIFIAAERLSDTTNFDVIFDLSRIIDEIYLMFKTPSKSNMETRIRCIEGIFISAQNQSILLFFLNIKKEFRKLKIHNREIEIEIRKSVKSIMRLEEKQKKDGEKLLDNLKVSYPNEEKILKLKKINNVLFNSFKKVINLLVQNNILFSEKSIAIDESRKERAVDKNFGDNFLNLLEEYKTARTVLIDILSRQGRHYKFAIADLRDAVDHIYKSFDESNNPLLEISYANEHIRRASVESIQTYVKSQLDNKYAIIQNNKKNGKEILKIFKIRMDVCLGRLNKADSTWYNAITYFYKALKSLEEWEINE